MDVRKLHISDYATIRLVGRKWTAKFALVCIFSLAPNCSMIGLTEEADADRATIEIILAFLNAENENDTSQIDRTPKLPDAAGDLLFSELQYNPAGPENLGEWIELYNPTNFIWNLKGCVLDESGGDDHTIASDVLVAPHDYAVLATIDSPEGVVPDYSYNDALRWNNTGETATILCNGHVLDVLDYSAAGFPETAGFDGVAISLDPDHFSISDNDLGANWCHAIADYAPGQKGTPGSSNPDC